MDMVVLRARVGLGVVERDGEEFVTFALPPPLRMVLGVPVGIVEPQLLEAIHLLQSRRQARDGPVGPLVTYWMDTPAEFDIAAGIGRCRLTSGGTVFDFKSTVATAQLGAANWMSAWVEHEAANRAQIVQLSERGPLFLRERHD